MRIFFHPSNFGVAANAAGIRMKASLPLLAFDTVANLRSEFSATTENVGNMVHNEAVAKSFEYNSLRSCCAPLYHFYVNESKSDRKLFQSNMKHNFDAVVLSLANLISPPAKGREEAMQKHMELLCEILDALPIPFYMFGLGLQNPVDDINKLVPGMIELLKLLNDKAAMFGVRGAQTEAFMHRNGFTNAKALGCPSLYIYPDNIMSIRAPDYGKNASVLTAGHLWLRNIFGSQPERIDFLRKLARTYKSSYVFQDDIYSFHELNFTRSFYDDANGLIDKEVMNNYLTAHGVEALPFADYWHFRDVRSWRMLAEKTDFYFGDRFHGGVVALQVGKPALFAHTDLRVEELTTHMGAPNCSLNEVLDQPFEDIVANSFSREKLEQFKDTYHDRAIEYYDTCQQAGMKPLTEVRSRLFKKQAQPQAWQKSLAAATCIKKKRNNLPKRVEASLRILSLDQHNHRSGELLVRTLIAEKMYDELNEVSTLMTNMEKGSTEWEDAEYFYRMAYFLVEQKRYEDALKFAEVYYNQIYKRKGPRTELYVTIQLELGNYEAAKEALLRRIDDEGYAVRFRMLLAKVENLLGKPDEARSVIKDARKLDKEGNHTASLSALEASIS